MSNKHKVECNTCERNYTVKSGTKKCPNCGSPVRLTKTANKEYEKHYWKNRLNHGHTSNEETVNELSKNTLRNYLVKSKKVDRNRDNLDDKNWARKFRNRGKGTDNAQGRLIGTMNTKHGSQSYHPEETVNELYGKGQLPHIAAHHMTKMMTSPSKMTSDVRRKHEDKFRKAVDLDAKSVFKKRHELNKKVHIEAASNPKPFDMVGYLSKGLKDKESKEIKFWQDARKKFSKKQPNKDHGAMQFHRFYQGNKNEETIHEVHPPGPGFESWVKHRKADFAKRYEAERGKRILYATAWKLKNKHPEGIKSHGE